MVLPTSVLDKRVDNQDYENSHHNEYPIGNLNARYRCFLAEPFHGFISQIGAPHLAASHASNTFTISPISQSRSVTLAAIAGVVRSVLWIRTVAQDRGDVAQGHDRSSFFTARMRSRAIHPASEAASGVEYDSPVLSAQLGSSIRVITEAAASEVGLAAEVRDLLKEVLADPTGWLGRQDSKLR